MTASWFLVALRHDRAVVLGSLAFVVLLAWSYLLLGAGVGPEMMDMGAGQMMAMPPDWSLGYQFFHHTMRRRPALAAAPSVMGGP
jgi:predicted metal-binding membrane protein